MKETITQILIAVCGIIMGLAFGLGFNVFDPERYIFIKTNNWDGERYQGWDMPCNDTKGGNSDLSIENYNYLDCANGIIYEKIGTSPRVTYFEPNDKVANEKYCEKGEVATFSYENPITKKGADEFQDCMVWQDMSDLE